MEFKNTIKKNWFPVLVMFLVALYFSFATHFFYFSNRSYGHDAGIFAYIGMAMNHGRALYTGAWDNKGPLLYIINWMGVSINYYYGIYFLELIALFTTVFFLYKTALLFCNRWISLLSAVFCMLPLSVSLEGGNLSEEYALPFTCIGLYLITKFFYQNFFLKKYEMLIVGICIGAIFMLRANILAFLGCLVITVTVVLINEKQYKRLGQVFLHALLGFIISILPVAIYLIVNGALKACLDTAYFGVVGSFTDIGKIARFKNVIKMIQAYMNSGGFFIIIAFILLFPVMVYCKKIKDKLLKYTLWACFAGMFVNLFANSLSGVYSMHYFMTFIPIMLIPTAWLLSAVQQYFARQTQPVYSIAITYTLVFFISLQSVPQLTSMVFNNLRDSSIGSKQYTLIGKYIEENSTPDDTVQLFGSAEAVTANYRTKRLAASTYNYYANGLFSEKAKDKFANAICSDVLQRKPRLIIIQLQSKYDDFLKHLNSDNSRQWQNMITKEYTFETTSFQCTVYHRKN